jgi:hypothetical protein
MMTGIGVQHRSESVFIFDRNGRSRWAGIRISDGIAQHFVQASGTILPSGVVG